MLCVTIRQVMLFSETNQEAYDNMLMAHRIAEHKDVNLPLMVCQDGFITSHSIENIELLETEAVRKFVGTYKPEHYLLNRKNPVAMGPMDLQPYLFEHKRQQWEAMKNAKQVILEVSKEFEALTGRKYNVVEQYDTQDAEVIIVALGTTVESARIAAKKARENGIKAGVVSIRVLRPFPYEALGEALKNCKAVAFLDRSLPAGAMGMLFNEGVAALYAMANKPIVSNYIYGLGGRDLTQNHLQEIFKELDADCKAGKLTHKTQQFIGLRGPKLGYI